MFYRTTYKCEKYSVLCFKKRARGNCQFSLLPEPKQRTLKDFKGKAHCRLQRNELMAYNNFTGLQGSLVYVQCVRIPGIYQSDSPRNRLFW